MRKFFLILVLCSVTSCGFFETKEEKAQKLIEQELSFIDWNEVDYYPLFDACDETAPKLEQKVCFEEKLIAHLALDLQDFKIIKKAKIKDLVLLDFMVERDGSISILAMDNEEVFGVQKNEFVKKVTKSISSLPRLEPALKRGIPVRAKFRIPIVLQSK